MDIKNYTECNSIFRESKNAYVAWRLSSFYSSFPITHFGDYRCKGSPQKCMSRWCTRRRKPQWENARKLTGIFIVIWYFLFQKYISKLGLHWCNNLFLWIISNPICYLKSLPLIHLLIMSKAHFGWSYGTIWPALRTKTCVKFWTAFE